MNSADTFSYDQANRLTSATVAGTTETATYDGDGVRFSRQVGAGPVIRAVTDPTAGLPVTIDDGSRKYVWGLGLAYAVAGTAIEVKHADRLGSIRAATDGTGAVIATYRTDEFGVPTSSTGSAGSPFRYTGEPLDASGLTYLRARHYDPSIGRFLSRDPFAGVAASPLSLNRYSYVGNNPATWDDPSGHCFVLCAIVGAGVGALVGAFSYSVGTAVGNVVSGRDLTEGWDAGAALVSAANGAVVGAVTGGTFGVGTALFGTSVAWNSVESFAIATVAGPLGSAAGIAFKGLTGQKLGPADALGALVSTVPLPDGPKVAIPIAIAVDQAVTAFETPSLQERTRVGSCGDTTASGALDWPELHEWWSAWRVDTRRSAGVANRHGERVAQPQRSSVARQEHRFDDHRRSHGRAYPKADDR